MTITDVLLFCGYSENEKLDANDISRIRSIFEQRVKSAKETNDFLLGGWNVDLFNRKVLMARLIIEIEEERIETNRKPA